MKNILQTILIIMPVYVTFATCCIAYDFHPSVCFVTGFTIGAFYFLILDVLDKRKKPNVVGHMTVTPLDENTGVMVEGLQIRGSLTLDMQNSGRTAIVSNNRIDVPVNHAGVELKA